jgi:DNA polymerase III subunit gamma/tau
MSYQVLARKWRPRNFSSLVGQEHVVRALNHALTEQRLHHAYIFTGTRGVGKTTIARILAKSLNCETGITAHPCGLCSACQEIDAGRFVDLLEVDAATNTRVEEMRQLLENAVYAPTRGRFKVYVIDEVHMLSNSAFNAMLKTLEEPPEHVKFILATTDPQKIPVTVLSRCLQFNLKQMVPAAISEYLTHILNAEGVPYELPALAVLAKGAAGSMRDALSLLDQAIAHGAGKVETDQVRAMLGAIDGGEVVRLFESLVANNLPEVVKGVDLLDSQSVSFASALQDLAAYLTQIQLLQLVPGFIVDNISEQPQLQALSKSLSPEAVQLAYQIVIQGRQELYLAPDEKSGFLMVMLRLFAFVPMSEVQSSVVVGQKPVTLERIPAQAIQMPSAASQQRMEHPVVYASEVQESSTPALVVNKLPFVPPQDLKDWRNIVAALDLSGMAKTLAQNCELREYAPPICLLRLSPSAKHLLMKPAQEKLQAAVSAYAGSQVQVRIEVAETEVDTPAVAVGKEISAKIEAAELSIEQDALINEMKSVLGATVLPGSVKPLERGESSDV